MDLIQYLPTQTISNLMPLSLTLRKTFSDFYKKDILDSTLRWMEGDDIHPKKQSLDVLLRDMITSQSLHILFNPPKIDPKTLENMWLFDIIAVHKTLKHEMATNVILDSNCYVEVFSLISSLRRGHVVWTVHNLCQPLQSVFQRDEAVSYTNSKRKLKNKSRPCKRSGLDKL